MLGNLLKRGRPESLEDAAERAYHQAHFLFILSPMRSGSTLLNHLLVQPVGYVTAGESHIRYRDEADLRRLMIFVANEAHLKSQDLAGKTYLEKCTQDELDNAALLNLDRVRTVFLFRQPLGTISSLMRLRNWPFTDSVESACTWYEESLRRLVRQFQTLRDPSTSGVVIYDDLLAREDEVLHGLSRFLGLAEPLRPEYQEQDWLLRSKSGDPSGNISYCRVKADLPRHPLELPDALRERVEAVFAETRTALASRLVYPAVTGT